MAEADVGLHTHRRRRASRLLSAVNEQAVDNYALNSVTILEEVIAQLRYYNPSAPSALVTADGATGTYQKEFLFTQSYAELTCANNYQIPTKVRIYWCAPKEDTSINPATAWSSGLTDVSAALATTDPLVYPTDAPLFNDLWKIERVDKGLIKPGDVMISRYSCKGKFSYDPSVVDSHNLSYQRKYKGVVVLLVVEGVVGHDPTANQVGILQSGIDTIFNTVHRVKYSAGADIKFVYTDDTSDSFTNTPVVSSMPIADNISYSVA